MFVYKVKQKRPLKLRYLFLYFILQQRINMRIKKQTPLKKYLFHLKKAPQQITLYPGIYSFELL